MRHYLAGRNPDLDKLFRWIEQQTSEIRHDDDTVCLDCAPHKVISQQFWALLGGLIKDDASVRRTFAKSVVTTALRPGGGSESR